MPRQADVDARTALTQAVVAHRRPPLARLLEPKGLGRYRGLGEMFDAVDRLVARGARVEEVGRSVRGEPLLMLSLGAPTPDARTRTSVVLAGVHPNEWIGVEVGLALLERLLREDLGARSVVAFPIVNPDGVLEVEMMLRSGRRRFIRHNAHGVDLNRNFDASWDRKGIGQRILRRLFASGPRPGSEPEVEAIAHALSARRIDRAVSLHSFGGAVLYPSSHSWLPVADAAEHRLWAKHVAYNADRRRPYRAIQGAWFSWGFTASGLELDWFHDRHGALSLLVECSRGGAGLRPSRLLSPFAWFNPPRIEDTTGPLVEALLPFVRGDAI
ncbi:MAG TPA: M14 family metallopeptidase [Minicystis sp.]|nr:M14 family metallopeptidase [Minicystis sp.]